MTGEAALERKLAVPQKGKELSTGPSSSMSGYTVRRTDNKCPHKNLDMLQVFIAALLIIAKTGNDPNAYQLVSRSTVRCPIIRWAMTWS